MKAARGDIFAVHRDVFTADKIAQRICCRVALARVFQIGEIVYLRVNTAEIKGDML